jgi:NarL family two-component system response regulator LiaR
VAETEEKSQTEIRILIVDDHAVVRGGLRAFISSTPGMKVVGEGSNGQDAVRLAEFLNPDVILMDLVMPGMDGIEAIKIIKKANPEARIMVVTSFAEDEKVFPAIKAGALGYLLKDSSPQELIQAIKEVYHGEAALHPSIARKLIREIGSTDTAPQPEVELTRRELEVLRLIAQGLTNVEIGQALNLSEWTVRSHVTSILSKLHLGNRTQAALYALQIGLIDKDQ